MVITFLLTCKHIIYGYTIVLCKRNHKLNSENKEYDNPLIRASDWALVLGPYKRSIFL